MTDFGIGMSETDIKNKLERDESSTKMGTNNEKGSGIGMSICKDFIRWHKGKLMIKSKVGEGTTVRFTIPQ